MKLLEYTIMGTRFHVDVRQGKLIEAGNPSNSIEFLEMDYNAREGYTFSYDTRARNLPGVRGYNENFISTVTIPQRVELDPAAMASMYHTTEAALKGKSDFELMVDQSLVARRLWGIMPIVSISGADFIVDYRLRELRSADDPARRIDLRELEYSLEKEHYQALYHPGTKSIAEVDQLIARNQLQNAVVINIPFEGILDPVGFAREMKHNVEDALIKYPPQSKRVILVEPLPESIQKLVSQKTDEESLQTIKEQPGRRRGKRL